MSLDAMPVADGPQCPALLEPAERLVLWMWRELHAECVQPSATLLVGLRLAFGLAGVERALAAVLVLWRCYDGHRRRPTAVAWHRTRLVSAEERLLIALIATAQQGADAHHAAIVLRLVRGQGAEALVEAARELALLLARAGFRLPCRIRDLPADRMASNGQGGWNLAPGSVRH